MTIKDLKQSISNLPDDGEVYVQRIEDRYFDNGGWETTLMSDDDGIKEYMDTWCAIDYDSKNLYITSHY